MPPELGSQADGRPHQILQQALQSSQTLEFGSGSRAVLSSRDFVPLSNRDTPSSSTARKELAGLYAAAGMKMKTGARQQQLAEVSGSFVRPQTQIDPGSRERLNAAARGKLDAFSRGGFPESSAELRSERSEHALGDTIAKYFRSAQKL